MTVHELLSDPDRASAFADLAAHPNGSVRIWADRWGWSLPRVHRFLRALEKAGLAQFERSKEGTALRSGDEVLPVTPTVTPPVTPLPSRPLDLLDRSREQNGVTPNYTETLIDAMNIELSRIYGSDYRKVKTDQHGSHRAGAAMQAKGIPLDFALERLLADCRTFNPSKHGKGKLPGSVAMFFRGIARAWDRRSQLELGMPPKLQISSSVQIDPPAKKSDPVPLANAIGDFRSAYEQAAATRRRE